MEKTFDFREALSFMLAGLTVVGPGGRLYRIETNEGKEQVICYPKPERPKQKRVEIKMNIDAILYKGWHLAE